MPIPSFLNFGVVSEQHVIRSRDIAFILEPIRAMIDYYDNFGT